MYTCAHIPTKSKETKNKIKMTLFSENFRLLILQWAHFRTLQLSFIQVKKFDCTLQKNQRLPAGLVETELDCLNHFQPVAAGQAGASVHPPAVNQCRRYPVSLNEMFGCLCARSLNIPVEAIKADAFVNLYNLNTSNV